MWTAQPGNPDPVRIDLRGRSGRDVVGHFSTEVGIGQYGITVGDHANGMATFAAGGRRADAHFVRSVNRRDGQHVYTEKLTQTDIGLDQEQIDELNWTLSKVAAAKLPNGWDAAGKTGTWQAGNSTTDNAHTWMAGYTRALAAAVWLGTTDGRPLITKDGKHDVFGASYPAPIWRQFMVNATAAMKLDNRNSKFGTPKFPAETASPAKTSPAPRPSTRPASPKPSCQPASCPRPKPSPTPTPTAGSPAPSVAPTQPETFRSGRHRGGRRSGRHRGGRRSGRHRGGRRRSPAQGASSGT
jgi:membrane peptidoglycan carboxypeptidase